MKKLVLVLITALIPGIYFSISAQNAFNKGVNLTGWFGAGSAKSVPFNKYTKKDLEEIKSLGCDVIRLPITLHYMTSGAPDYIIDTLFLKYLDQVIAWTDELGINLIIDNHTIEVAKNKDVEIPLLKIWPQMAQHYKDFSTKIFFEILNEPNTLLASDWNKIQIKVVDTIRTIDTKHTILVTGADWGGIAGLLNLPVLADTNLIYSFHFYDPFLFTHQGASWASPSMADLANVPFPYDAARIPACPTSLKGTWVESSLKTAYKTDGTVAKLKSTIDQAIAYATKNKVKIYCGELGVYIAQSPLADRVEWYKAVTGYLTSKSVPWTMWDYQGGFGLFNKGSNEVFEYDINRPMAEGMGFTIPPYKEYVMKPDSVDFEVYTDYFGEGIQAGAVPGGGVTDLNNASAYNGAFSIYMTGSNQYDALDFDFRFNKDMSLLRASNTTVSLMVKCASTDANVVLRFLDTKTADPKDHPWRMDYTLGTSTSAPFDGQWHNVIIPFKKFKDAGSWDGAWFNSMNAFDWKAVDKFQIVAENMKLAGKEFWFDDIKIIKGEFDPTSQVEKLNDFELSIYPNPAREQVNLKISSAKTNKLSVSVYSITGQWVSELNNNNVDGYNTFIWKLTDASGNKVPGGVYFCKIKLNNTEITRKVTVLR